MAKIKIGKQKGKSSSTTLINLSINSLADISFGTINDESVQKIIINDKDNVGSLIIELADLSKLLSSKGELYKDELKFIRKAQQSVQEKDSKGLTKWLKKAGEVTFEVAIENGLVLTAKIISDLISNV